MTSSSSSTSDEHPLLSLVLLAQQVLVLLEAHDVAHAVTTDAVGRALRYLAGRPLKAEQLGEYLNHSDPDLDLSAQYSFVDGDEHAIAALDVVSLATGAVVKLAYDMVDQPMPEPVLLATPEVAAQAFIIYDELADQGLVAVRSKRDG